jgi:Spy/CpxP family protein refolding chaperone
MKEFSMKRIRLIAAIVVAAGVSAGSAALAQGLRGGGHGGPGGPGRAGGPGGLMGGLPLASLNLTEAQQDAIRDIRERNREEMRQVETRLREAHAAQQKAIDAIPPNEGAIRAATLALADVQAEVAVLQARVRNDIVAVLTSEQQAQLTKLLAQRDERMRERQAQIQQRRQNRQN